VNNLANHYADVGRYAEAFKLHEDDDPETLRAMRGLAATCERTNDLAKAEALCRKLMDIRRRQLGSAHVVVAESLARLGQVLLKQGKYAQAEPLLRESLAVWQKQWPDNWRRFWTMSLLGGARLGLARYIEA
jgi:tetratricopeptide (TPR) repeat protein